MTLELADLSLSRGDRILLSGLSARFAPGSVSVCTVCVAPADSVASADTFCTAASAPSEPYSVNARSSQWRAKRSCARGVRK